MNPIGLLILAGCVVTILSGSRHRALLGVTAAILYLPFDQHLVIAGTNLFALRFVELAAFTRVWGRKEFSRAKVNSFDKLFLLLFVYTTLVFVLRSNEDVAYRVGVLVDASLCYITFRGLIQEPDDIRLFLKSFVYLVIPFVLCVSFETLKGHNPFELLGRYDPAGYTRNGRQRAFGSFLHPSLVGTVGAAFIPLYFALGYREGARKIAIVGIGLCLVIIWAANSGAPISCLLFAAVGWFCWRIRTKMQLLRRIIVVSTVVLALVMKSPIWYLPTHLSDFTGGDGYHRSYLLDIAFQNVRKWGLAGMPLAETADWFPTQLAWGVADMTDQYISFGVTAGLGAMALFIAIFVRGFSRLGRAMNALRFTIGSPSEAEFFLWGLGVVLLVHAGNLFGISYYDQSFAIWYMQLAMISGISELYLKNPRFGLDETAHIEESETDLHPPISAGG